jgi:acetyl esterase/lipase
MFVHDAAGAVKWAADNAPRFGGDANRLFVMGHSAGAHIAMMLSLDRAYLAAVGMSPRQLRGAIGLAGPYDFLPLSSDRLKEIFGPEEAWPRSQPVNFVRGEEPPLLLATGDADDIVKPRNTASLAARVRAAGGVVKEITYPKAGHVSIVVDLASPFRGRSPVFQDVAAFIREASGNPLASR